jgi:cell division protein FtsI (penicillin-binding protein 3)
MRTGVDPRQGRWIAVRIAMVAACLAVGFFAVGARAVKLQVLERDKLRRHGRTQWEAVVELRPRRGAITDRNGEVLAASADAYSIAADPGALQDLDRASSARLAKALGLDGAALARKAQRGGRFTWLKRRVSPAEARAVQALELDGVAVLEESRRYYPAREVAAQVVGFVGDDGEGLEGVEKALDGDLQGGAVRLPSVRDARGRAVLDEAPAPEAVLAGARVELAIDVGLQHAAEQALSRAVTQARAQAGMLVAMDPRTGEVLALANAPTVNPNGPRHAGSLRNRAVVDVYEPGSTFKLFTIAGALDAGVLGAKDAIDCENGAYRVGSHVIHDHKGLGWVGPSRIVATSSNIGAAKIGARLGRERLQKTLFAFGFGEKSGTDLPGEPRGLLPFPKAEVALATMSFGQGVAATPLQITTAVAAIANGGMLMRPLLVRRVVDTATGAVTANDPTPIRRAVSRESAALLARWMEGVVSDQDGTGKRARLEGWRVAGKTGTAQKADAVTHRYSVDKRFSSFVGFAPADAPRVVIGVFIDEPRGEVYGGEVAAPVFRELADRALKSLGVPPSAVADLSGHPERSATDRSREVEGRSGRTEERTADAPDEAPARPLFEEAALRAEEEGGVAVPELLGLPARAALRALEERELMGDVRGSGRVASQRPRPGDVVERGSRVVIVLAPPRS